MVKLINFFTGLSFVRLKAKVQGQKKMPKTPLITSLNEIVIGALLKN